LVDELRLYANTTFLNDIYLLNKLERHLAAINE